MVSRFRCDATLTATSKHVIQHVKTYLQYRLNNEPHSFSRYLSVQFVTLEFFHVYSLHITLVSGFCLSSSRRGCTPWLAEAIEEEGR